MLTLKTSDKKPQSAQTISNFNIREAFTRFTQRVERMSPLWHYKFQRRLSDLRSFRFLWILLVVYICHLPLVHTDLYQDLIDEATSRDLLHTSRETKPPRRITTSSPATTSTRSITTQRNYIADLKSHIKRVLNLESSDDASSIDQYVANAFNIHNQDPLYVFVLPGIKNETVVLRRSNFDEAVFPNVTTLQTLRKIAKQSKWLQGENADRKSEKFWKNDERFRTKYEQFKQNANDLDEIENMKIVEENTRTERNFLKYIETLNVNELDNNRIDSNTEMSLTPTDDNSDSESQQDERHLNEYESLLVDVHSKEHIGKYGLGNGHWDAATSKRPINTKVSWKDLGLDGWTGDIQANHRHPEENSKPIPVAIHNAVIKNPHILPHNLIPILANFDPLSFLTTAAPVRQPIGNLFEANWKKPRPSVPSNVGIVHVNNDKKHSTSIHQFSFITHSKPDHSGHPPSQSHAVHLFRPAASYLPTSASPTKHRDPHDWPARNDTWEINFVVPPGLRDLLKLEREKLRNLTHDFYGKQKLNKWPVTSSRSAHRDNDIFIGRANNPFGHSTKWKLSNNSNAIDNDENRHKRGVVELYSMVKCSTGCDPLIYKGYGCYCGFLGRGRTLDGIDRCCKMHDYCYEVTNCHKYLEYFVPYLWKCYRGRPLCAIDHGEWGGPGSCASMLCECDKALSKCLSRFYCPRKRAVCTSSPLRLLQNILMDFGL